jgi:zinc protease
MRMRSVITRSLALAMAVTAVAPAPATAQRPQAARQNSAINIPFEKYTLPNGLTVILSPNQATPTIAVDVWYHVGSKNERPGRTGFAHLFEHVMFTGSGNVAYGLHDRLTEGVGGNNNGSTTEDRTNYWENVPANYLESTLWLEADRMGFLLDKLDSAKFVAQRDIVQNERRQSTDNAPYGRWFELLSYGMFPEDNPYHWPVVGYMTDLQAASLQDVKDFFKLYYAPTNATLAIVGDFDPVQAKAWVAKYFGDLPRGAAITRPVVTLPKLTQEVRMAFEDRVQIPRAYVSWPTVGAKHDDQFALNVLSSILSGSRTARLTKALVYDKQSASELFTFYNAAENAGAMYMMLNPRPGNTLNDLLAAADSVIDRFKREGPTADEMARALAGLEFQFVNGLQSNLGKAETLLQGSVFHGDPGWYAKRYAKMKAVTAADVKRVANTYLGSGRVVLSVVPEGKTSDAASNSKRVTVAADGSHYTMEK